MKAILKFFRKRWVVSLLGILALSLIIWFVGPLIAFAGREPLVSPLVRGLVIVFAAFLWIIISLLRQVRASKSDKGIVDGIVEAETPAGPSQSDEEVAELRERFEEATTVLKKSGDGSKSLYSLPWYIIIGPPGSGKTTALINSGLEFPLADRFGREALRGVGGTRNCDWWFTESAVLLDTAGRYTTQDSHADVDSAAWSGFLDLIKKHRKRRPINGVLIALSISDLLLLDESERITHVTAIKKRIQELYEHFGIRFPIYVLLTKSDLIAGFMEFFDDLGDQERRQAWGYTLPLIDAKEASFDFDEQLGIEFDALVERMNQRLFSRLSQERDPARRALIYGFPRQLASLREIINGFLVSIFRPSRFETPALLRGVYFTSGTQEGSPIDRVMGSLARTFGVDQHALPAYGGPGRSYFINKPLTEVAFVESELAGANVKLERRRAMLQWGAYAAAAGIVLSALIGWSWSYLDNKRHIRQVEAQALEINESTGLLRREHDAPRYTLPLLNAARNIPGGYADRRESTWLSDLGLYPARLSDAANDAYFRLLSNAFLPRLQLELEGQLRRGGDSPDYLFEALKTYLMLDNEARFDPTGVAAWIRIGWQETLPREVAAEERAQLESHLDALLTNMPPRLQFDLDRSLIEQSRRVVSRMPLSERIYGRLKRSKEATELPQFTLADAGGRDAPAVLRRKSNLPLTDGIPGFFTYDGYHKVFEPLSGQVANRVADESWILGEAGAIDEQSMLTALKGDESEREKLDNELAERYLQEYARQYNDLLADITLVPIDSLADAAQVLRLLSDEARSPLLRVLRGVARQTNLQRVAEEDAGEKDKSTGAIRAQMEELSVLVGARKPAIIEQVSAKQRRLQRFKKRYFGDMQEMIMPDQSGSSPFDSVMALLEELYVFIDSVNSSSNPEQEIINRSQELNALVGDMKREGERAPPVVSNVLTEVTGQVQSAATGDVYAHLNRLWASEGLDFCRTAIANRYPVLRGASAEIRLGDFADFFGPGGIMDRFFSSHLATHVDTSRSTWRWRPNSGMFGRASRASLAQFQRADSIRKTYFRLGNSPRVRFDLRPVSMDADITRFVLTLGGKKVEYSHGPSLFTAMEWPGDGPPEVRVEMMPPTGRGPVTETGDWAWFRVLESSSMTKADRPEHFNILFSFGGRTATWELRAASALNPFKADSLQGFSCPGRL